MSETVNGTVCCPHCTTPINITFDDGLLIARTSTIINDHTPELRLNPSDLGVEEEAGPQGDLRPDLLSESIDGEEACRIPKT